MNIKILYEDPNILAIDKLSGILAHPDKRSEEKTIFDLFVKKYPKLEIVHRLDRDTSGVMLLAKNKKAHEFLKKQFSSREIKKKPIGRSPTDFRRRLAGRGARGELREAITEYKVLKHFKNFSYLEIKPKTGRTHQIRVHMKYINHPIICDLLYNPSGLCPKDISRMALHAKSIEFKNLKNRTTKVESPLPKEFKKMLKS